MALTNLFLNLKPKLSAVSYTSSLKNVVINPTRLEAEKINCASNYRSGLNFQIDCKLPKTT